jgi:hypothetical protein
MPGGGDTRTPGAKQKIAQREEQIVALRLRHHSFTAIGRVVGLSRQNCQKAFVLALHRTTNADIQTHHRSELAELEAGAKVAWELVDVKENPKTRAAGLTILNQIHIRRDKLLGLDAATCPAKHAPSRPELSDSIDSTQTGRPRWCELSAR